MAGLLSGRHESSSIWRDHVSTMALLSERDVRGQSAHAADDIRSACRTGPALTGAEQSLMSRCMSTHACCESDVSEASSHTCCYFCRRSASEAMASAIWAPIELESRTHAAKLPLLVPTASPSNSTSPTASRRSTTCIAAQARKLDALKRHKQGLLQQLFPSSEEESR